MGGEWEGWRCCYCKQGGLRNLYQETQPESRCLLFLSPARLLLLAKKVPSSGQSQSGLVVGGRGMGGGGLKINKKKTTELRRNTTHKVILRVGIFL